MVTRTDSVLRLDEPKRHGRLGVVGRMASICLELEDLAGAMVPLSEQMFYVISSDLQI